VLQVIMPGHRPAWSKLGACEEITDLLKRSAVLQGETHQAGDDVVEPDQLGGAVGTFQAQEDFSGMFVVMDAEIERPLAGDFDFLCNVVSTVGKDKASALQTPSLSDFWLRLVADLRMSCSVLP
jgi:hypothetical protein